MRCVSDPVVVCPSARYIHLYKTRYPLHWWRVLSSDVVKGHGLGSVVLMATEVSHGVHHTSQNTEGGSMARAVS